MQAIWTGWNEDSAQHEIEKFKAMKVVRERELLWSVRQVKTLTPPSSYFSCHGRFAARVFLARRRRFVKATSKISQILCIVDCDASSSTLRRETLIPPHSVESESKFLNPKHSTLPRADDVQYQPKCEADEA